MNKQAHIRTSGEITRATLLGFLSFRPMHGYEIRRQIEGQRREWWADIQYGSIYASLRQLDKEGLVEEAGTEQEGNRPPRTVYRITEAGREELTRLLKEAWIQPTFSARPMDTALSFIWLLHSGEVERLLEERLERLEEGAEELDASEEQKNRAIKEQGISMDPGVEAMVSDIFEHSRRLISAEQEWTGYVLDRVRSGAYQVDEETIHACRTAKGVGAEDSRD